MNQEKIKKLLHDQRLIGDCGFYIFRIREANEGNDFILYNIKNQCYNVYSKKKIKDMLKMELREKFITLKNSFSVMMEDKDFLEFILINHSLIIDNINFYPEEYLLFEEEGKLFFNIYKKPKFMKDADKEEIKDYDYSEQFGAIKNLLKHICITEDVYNYVLKWYAWKIQYPHIKLPTALIFQSEKGTGKTKFQELVIKKIFEHLWRAVNVENFEEKYNSYLFGVLLVHMEEAVSDESKEKTSQKVKSYVSDTQISLRVMNKDPYNVKCYANISENTNTHKPINLEENDRRYIIVGFQQKKIDNTIIQALIDNQDEEVKAFYYYLKNLKLDQLELINPIHTEAKTNIRKYTMTSIDNFFDEFDFNVFEPKDLIKEKFFETQLFYKRYLTFCQEYGYKNPSSRNKFTMELKMRGYIDTVLWDKDNKKSIRAIKVIKEDE